MTFNTHRIHYDRVYALHVEGYPGLAVLLDLGPVRRLATPEADVVALQAGP